MCQIIPEFQIVWNTQFSGIWCLFSSSLSFELIAFSVQASFTWEASLRDFWTIDIWLIKHGRKSKVFRRLKRQWKVRGPLRFKLRPNPSSSTKWFWVCNFWPFGDSRESSSTFLLWELSYTVEELINAQVTFQFIHIKFKWVQVRTRTTSSNICKIQQTVFARVEWQFLSILDYKLDSCFRRSLELRLSVMEVEAPVSASIKSVC